MKQGVVAIDVESFCACVAEMHEVQEQARSRQVYDMSWHLLK